MKKLGLFALMALLVASLASACDVGTQTTKPIEDFELRGFGERCEQHVECESTYCMSYPQGSFCTKPCDEGCPDTWVCQEVDSPHGTGRVSLCALARHSLCKPCQNNEVCGVGGANWCVELTGGDYCAMDCNYQACPDGYACSEVTLEAGRKSRQCLPTSGSCECNAESLGQVRGCENSNSFGICQGVEVCTAEEMWSTCGAKTPEAETCNGLDDNCDGFIDENTDGQDCAITNENGSCKGKNLCAGAEGLVCVARSPEAEICNGIDDNCNEEIDEGFRDAQGIFSAKAHCGACNQDCDLLMQNATETKCVVIDEQAQCRAVACEEGYFPYLDGVSCMALPDNLCIPCSQDSDCIGPESRCVDIGNEFFCGRDCSESSAYGKNCPLGFVCSDVKNGKKQCVPETKTCLCNVKNLNSARSCLVDTCVGFEWCLESASTYKWSTCQIDKYNIEICDGLDNNCDGRIDEGMLNPSTGLYDATQHCGYCFNDCTTYYKPEIHHVEGVCAVSAGVARCGMGPCKTEFVDGRDYEWVDTDKIVENGCECRRVLGNLSKDLPDVVANYSSGYRFLDQNCDGIDGVIAYAIFVSATAPDKGDGSLKKPFKTITEALKSWPTANKSYILVAEGLYEEDLNLPDGVVLHGGYSINFKERDLVQHASVVRGVSEVATLRAVNLKKEALIHGFVIEAADRSQFKTGGKASIAVYLQNCSDLLVLRANAIRGSSGEPGAVGASGAAGNGRTSDKALDGGDGINSERIPGPCINSRNNGGRSGRNQACTDATSTPGATTACPSFNWTNFQGGQSPYPNQSLNRGLGGFDMSFDEHSSSGCGHATESGFPNNIQSNVGDDGRNGVAGEDARGGRGALTAYGSVKNGLWYPLSDALAGKVGAPGQAGGGGGGGGGVAYYNRQFSDCPFFELGPSGGGGGAGGCGGGAGSRGGNGGASIAVFIVSANYTTNVPQLIGNVISRGSGGVGGNGGIGGGGGIGGNGGLGGVASYWVSTKAGRGGVGGTGGRGGGGGGGAGGPSFDILGYNTSTNSLIDTNIFLYEDTLKTGGVGGNGGVGGAGGKGSDGITGASARKQDLRQCSTTGTCATGLTCNPDSVCIPNN